jgi:hypothetical protein
MRVAELFKRVLGIERGRVVGVEWLGGDPRAGVLVELALPARRAPRCAGCGGSLGRCTITASGAGATWIWAARA